MAAEDQCVAMSIRAISHCSRPMRTSASTRISASIRWPSRAPLSARHHRPYRLRRLDADHAGRAPARARPPAHRSHQTHPDGARDPARRALFQGPDPFDLSHARPLRRQSRRRARGLAGLFRQGTGASGSLRSRHSGGAAAIARASAPRPPRHPRQSRPRQVLARMVDDGVVTASDAKLAMREGVVSQRLAMPLDRAASGRASGRRAQAPAPDRHHARCAAASGAGAPRRAGTILLQRWRQPRHRRRRQQDPCRARLCRRHALLGPGRADRSGAPRAFARLGAQAFHLRHGVRRSDPASQIHDAGSGDQFRRLRAARFLRRLPGRGDGHRCACANRSTSPPSWCWTVSARSALLWRCPMPARIWPSRRAMRCRPCRWRWAGSASALPTSPCSIPASPMAARQGRCAICRPPRKARRIGCSERSPRIICARSSMASRCPMAGRWGRASRASAPSASRPAPPMASAMPGRSASPTITRSGSGSAAPMARRAPAMSAAKPPRPSC